MDLKKIGDAVMLCCGRKRCPILTKSKDGSYDLTDDFGGKVKLSREQLLLISDAIIQLDD